MSARLLRDASPASAPAFAIPRLPVFGWAAWKGHFNATTSCMLDLPGMYFTTSGRASILLALEALEVRARDRVLVPTYHCLTMVSPAVARGAEPLFYPLTECGAPDLAWLDKLNTSRVRAIIVPHFFGLPQPMAPVRRWCDARGIALIEDCAHAMFGRSDDRAIGQWGDLAIGSLTKFLPVPEGGCLVINNNAQAAVLDACESSHSWKAVLDVVEEGARHGRLPGLNGLLTGTLSTLRSLRRRDKHLLPPVLRGIESKDVTAAEEGLTIDLTAAHRHLALACRWLARHLPRERIVRQRRARYQQLVARLSGYAGMHPLHAQLPEHCAPYVFPLWVDNPDPGYAALRAQGMPVFRWDRLWKGVPSIAGDHGIRWSHHVLQLACHQDLNDNDFERYVATIVRHFSTASKATEPGAEPAGAGP